MNVPSRLICVSLPMERYAMERENVSVEDAGEKEGGRDKEISSLSDASLILPMVEDTLGPTAKSAPLVYFLIICVQP